jgi:Arc/MetJ-type ribon-helix-helix transcriptional regulator
VKKGQDVHRGGGDARFNVSLSPRAAEVVDKLVTRTKSKNRSVLVRKALAQLADSLGLHKEATIIAE